jgi:hypothetical protein
MLPDGRGRREAGRGHPWSCEYVLHFDTPIIYLP